MNKIQLILSELYLSNESTNDHPFAGIDVTSILTDNKNIFNLPPGKKFWDMPISYYVDLVSKKGRVVIEGALLNLRIFNINKNPNISKQAENIRLELKKKLNW